MSCSRDDIVFVYDNVKWCRELKDVKTNIHDERRSGIPSKEGNGFYSIVTGDETQATIYEWRHNGSPSAK